MAILRIPKKEFEKHIKLTPDTIEKISMSGIPLENVTDDEIELEVLANRPDILSVQGFLRHFKAYLGKEPGLKKYKINPPEKNYKVKIDPSVEKVRPFTACAIVRRIKFDDEKIKEIIDLQEKLHATVGRNRKKVAIGIYPLEKITLPIKFEARDPREIKFRPLESDVEMNGFQILQRHHTGREYAHLLDGLSKFPIFSDAKGNILSMPPIINSHDTGKITEQTDSVFVECSGFNFETQKKVLNIIVTTLAEMGGKICQMELEYKKKEITPDLNPEKLKVSLEHANKILGLDLKEKDLEKLLPRMGYDYKSGIVSIPQWRSDILHEVDVIEDIAIAYGYDHLIPEVPSVSTVGEESLSSRVSRKIADILVGLGMLETSSYHLIKDEESAREKLKEQVETESSKSEYKILRPNLIIPALRTLSENKDNEYPQRFFEIGTVFNKDKKGITETGIDESEHLLIACSPANFTEIKQVLDYLAKMLGIQFSLRDSSHPDLIEGRTGSVMVENKEIGHLGEVDPDILRAWGISMPVAVLEISLEEIFKIFSQFD